ncbi:helix-turn-helix domain-containing protein [Vibrio astriarenae]|uniref:Helix-turn-helix domain-containing protein n=1 Tax=Vibrio astriarenae TaxID=1481923 RepID=A0A7Z2T713_9VIBR|nr:PocR ligand-binding domain-containing protein [Vibrio astriarenae]QIA65445.1 helix-turn-helix domain-containing protein [Vibrio astriarenae]
MISSDAIKEIAYDFAMATGFAVLVVDLDGNEISPRFNFTPLCKHVRTKDALFEICKRCDRVGGLTALQQKETTFYRCHMGLVDFSIPLIVGGNLLGFVQCGQAKITDTQQIPLITQHKYDRHHNNEIQRMYDDLPSVRLQKMQSSSSILKALIDNYLPSKLITDPELTNSEVSIARPSSKNQLRIEQSIEFIERNLSAPLTLDCVAHHVDLSPFYFSRLFKDHLQVGFNHYLNKQRISKSKQLLANNNKPISDIARSVGFNNTSYFIRQFKKQCELTPLEFRNNHSHVSAKILEF